MVGVILLFGFAVSASLLWLGGVSFYIYAKIGFPNLFALPTGDVIMLAATAFLPVFFLWMVVCLMYNVLTLRKQGATISVLLTQTRRSADHAEAMVRTLMETQLQSRSAMVLHNADLFINELNDLLSDIVVRFGLVPPAHTEMIWQRVGDGNRWAFCKVILRNAENSPKFQDDLKDQLFKDQILAHAVRTFCYRFEQMFTMLERHDIEHYLTKIFEEGAMGRVYLRFVEACRAAEVEQAARDQEMREPVINVPKPVTPAVEPVVVEPPPVPKEPPAPAKKVQEPAPAPAPAPAAVKKPEEKPAIIPPAVALAKSAAAEREEPEPPAVRDRPSDTSAPFGFLRPTR